MADEHTTDLSRGIYRRIYAGFLKGKRINSVSLQAEALFWRLHALADDFGNLGATPSDLVFEAFPRRSITVTHIETWIGELVAAGLVVCYSVAGEPYLSIVDWEAYQPANRSGRRVRRVVGPGESWGVPGNPGESGGTQGSPGESGAPIPIPIPIPIPKTIPISAASPLGVAPVRRKRPEPEEPPPMPPELDNPDYRAAWADWTAYRAEMKQKPYKRLGLKAAWAEHARWGSERAVAAIRHSMAKGWVGIHEPNAFTARANGTNADARRAAKAATEYDEDIKLPMA